MPAAYRSLLCARKRQGLLYPVGRNLDRGRDHRLPREGIPTPLAVLGDQHSPRVISDRCMNRGSGQPAWERMTGRRLQPRLMGRRLLGEPAALAGGVRAAEILRV